MEEKMLNGLTEHQWEKRVSELRNLLASGIKGEKYRKAMEEYRELLFSEKVK